MQADGGITTCCTGRTVIAVPRATASGNVLVRGGVLARQ